MVTYWQALENHSVQYAHYIYYIIRYWSWLSHCFPMHCMAVVKLWMLWMLQLMLEAPCISGSASGSRSNQSASGSKWFEDRKRTTNWREAQSLWWGKQLRSFVRCGCWMLLNIVECCWCVLITFDDVFSVGLLRCVGWSFDHDIWYSQISTLNFNLFDIATFPWLFGWPIF